MSVKVFTHICFRQFAVLMVVVVTMVAHYYGPVKYSGRLRNSLICISRYDVRSSMCLLAQDSSHYAYKLILSNMG
jgi:hypothetical protein